MRRGGELMGGRKGGEVFGVSCGVIRKGEGGKFGKRE